MSIQSAMSVSSSKSEVENLSVALPSGKEIEDISADMPRLSYRHDWMIFGKDILHESPIIRFYN